MVTRRWILLMVPFFLVTQFKIIDFLSSADLTCSFYIGNPEDLRDGVGDIFARRVMQIPNLVTVLKSEQT